VLNNIKRGGITTTSIADFCSYIDYPPLFIKEAGDVCGELMTVNLV
jgi:hypothetical protein